MQQRETTNVLEEKVDASNQYLIDLRELQDVVSNSPDLPFMAVVKQLDFQGCQAFSEAYWSSTSTNIEKFIPILAPKLLPWLQTAKKQHDDYVAIKDVVDKLLELSYRTSFSKGYCVSNEAFQETLNSHLGELEKKTSHTSVSSLS